MNSDTLARANARVEKMRRENDDIFVSARQKLLDESQQEFLRIPKDFNANFEKHGGWAGAVSGMTAGAALGAHVTVFTLGTGVIATIPLALVGGVIGYFGGAKAGSKIEKDK